MASSTLAAMLLIRIRVAMLDTKADMSAVTAPNTITMRLGFCPKCSRKKYATRRPKGVNSQPMATMTIPSME